MNSVESIRARPALQSRSASLSSASPLTRQRIATLLFIAAMIGAVTDGLFVPVGDFPLTLERATGLLIIGTLLLSMATDAGAYPGKLIVYLWLAWNVVLLVSATLAPSPFRHTPAFIIALIPTATFWLIARHQFDLSMVQRVIRAMLWFNGIVGVVALFIKLGAGVDLPLMFDQEGRLKVLISEANIFGSEIGFFLLASLGGLRRSLASVVLVGLTLVVLLASGSRMPYIAFVFCIIIYGVLRAIASRKGTNQSIIFPVWLIMLLLTAALLFASQILSFYENSLNRTGTIAVRAYIIDIALQRFQENPIIGNGPGDFNLQSLSVLQQYGAQNQQTLWIPNMIVSVLHDSGLVGGLIYALTVLSLIGMGMKSILQGSVQHAGFLVAFLFLIICSQATTVHLLIIYGIAAGLVALPASVRRIAPASAYRKAPLRGAVVAH